MPTRPKKLVLDSDLLIVDDLGCERQTEFAQSALFNVLNERLVRGKKMLISTNLSTKEIKDVYNSRFFSRLIEISRDLNLSEPIYGFTKRIKE